MLCEHTKISIEHIVHIPKLKFINKRRTSQTPEDSPLSSKYNLTLMSDARTKLKGISRGTYLMAFGIVALGRSASDEHIAINSGPPIEKAAKLKTPQKPRKRPRAPSTRLNTNQIAKLVSTSHRLQSKGTRNVLLCHGTGLGLAIKQCYVDQYLELQAARTESQVWDRTHVLPVPKSDPVVVGIAAKHGDERKHDEADNENDFSRGEVELRLKMQKYNREEVRKTPIDQRTGTGGTPRTGRALYTYLAIYFDRECVEDEDDDETVRDPDCWGRVG